MATSAQDRTKRVEREIFMRTLSLGRASGGAARAIAEHIEEVFFQAGDTIYRVNDSAEAIYFVLHGDVRLAAEGVETWNFKDRSVVGILDVLVDRPRARTATAVSDVHALRLRAEDYFDVLEDNFEWTRGATLGVAADLHRISLSLAPDGGFVDPPTEAGRADPRRLNIVQRISVLRESEAFRGSGIQALTSMARLVEEVRLAADEPLFRMTRGPGSPDNAGRGSSSALPESRRRGTPSIFPESPRRGPGSADPSRRSATKRFFLVESGLIEVERTDPEIRARFGPRSLVCGYGALGDAEEHYNARALVPSVVFSVREEDFFDLLELHFDMARSVLVGMALERERLMRIRGQREAAPLPQPIGGALDGEEGKAAE